MNLTILLLLLMMSPAEKRSVDGTIVAQPTKECVILLHGLARGANSMKRMQKHLQHAGYHVVNQAYDSTTYSIEELSQQVIPTAVRRCREQAPVRLKYIHFVTHSMGGILLRHHTQQAAIENLGRVVMLGPPNQGSEVVDQMKNWPGFQRINGPAGMQLGTDADSWPRRLGPVNFELGVIAGSRSINLLLSRHLPNPDDGKVSVASTRVLGMQDHMVLPVTHTFMMRNRQVMSQTLWFLQQGTFNH